VFADSGDYKLVLIVRNDLKMGKGKAAAQVRIYKCLVYSDEKCSMKYRFKKCAHATVGCCKNAMKKSDIFRKWESVGQPKVVLKCDTEKDL
jgi:PTH2 family peptidyl-tRNA hydrolase